MPGNANDSRNVEVVCPYFHRFGGNGKRSIVCAGIFEGSENITVFANEELLAEHLKICCNTMDYMDCRLAEAIRDMGLTE